MGEQVGENKNGKWHIWGKQENSAVLRIFSFLSCVVDMLACFTILYTSIIYTVYIYIIHILF